MATQRDIADHLGISQPTVAGLVRDKVIPAAARGKYDQDACRLAYCAHLREEAAGRAPKPGVPLDLVAERARLAAAQAEAQERKNARERGELLPAADVSDAVHKVFLATKQRFLTLPAAFAHRLAGAREPAAIRRILDQAVHDVLDALATPSLAHIEGVLAGSITMAPGPSWIDAPDNAEEADADAAA